jgi:hypothetical protein
MKIILLVLAVCFLVKSIKGIPVVFSNKRFKKSLLDMKEASSKMQEATKWTEEGTKSFILIISKFIYFAYGIVFLIFGTYIKEPIIITLTIINLVQILLIDIPTVKNSINSNFEEYGKLYSNI